MDLPKKTKSIFMKVTVFHEKLGYFMFLYIYISHFMGLSLHYSQNKPKENSPEKTKWASIPHEAYFIAPRNKLRCSSKSIYQKSPACTHKMQAGLYFIILTDSQKASTSFLKFLLSLISFTSSSADIL